VVIAQRAEEDHHAMDGGQEAWLPIFRHGIGGPGGEAAADVTDWRSEDR
jgi:hypothetical protein